MIARGWYVKLLKKNGCKVLSVHNYSMDEYGKSYPIKEIWENSSYLKMFNNSSCRRISLGEKVYKPPFVEPNPNWSPTGSFLPPLCALSFFAKKINVYGWDFYLDFTPAEDGYWKSLFSVFYSRFRNLKQFLFQTFHTFFTLLDPTRIRQRERAGICRVRYHPWRGGCSKRRSEGGPLDW